MRFRLEVLAQADLIKKIMKKSLWFLITVGLEIQYKGSFKM